MKILWIALFATQFLFACQSKGTSTTTDGTVQVDSAYYTSETGKFSVKFPGKPEVTKEKVATELGDIDMEMFMYEQSSDMLYMVAYSDYPESHMKANPPMELMNNSKAGIVSSIKGNITKEDTTAYATFSSLYFEAMSEELFVAYRLIIKGNRLYQVCIMQGKTAPTQEAVDGFINTFTLNS